VPRVFLDANVLFSASRTDSAIAQLVHLLIDVGEPITSDLAVIEARRNVSIKWPDHVSGLEAIVDKIQRIPSVIFDLPVELIDKDRPILCAAIRGDCQYLVTGDRTHFGHLYDHTIEGVTVITLQRLAEQLTKE